MKLRRCTQGGCWRIGATARWQYWPYACPKHFNHRLLEELRVGRAAMGTGTGEDAKG